MKNGYVFRNSKNQYLAGGFFWSNEKSDAYVFDENEIEKNILPYYMRWDFKPIYGYVSRVEDGENFITHQAVPFWKFEEGDL